MKRAFDVAASLAGLIVLSPFLGLACLLVYLGDFHSPFYVASRAGRHGKPFRMVKLRSMRVNADRTGVSSTAGDDPRITRVGMLLRRTKLDELPQLWSVLKGDMSLVGPRPQVLSAVARYTPTEMRLLDVRPGITDLASIAFADEGEILRGSADADLRYEQIIRPWKSRLGILYVENAGSVTLDLRIIALTILSAVSRHGALRGVSVLAGELGADPQLVQVARRDRPLEVAAPPGADGVVESL